MIYNIIYRENFKEDVPKKDISEDSDIWQSKIERIITNDLIKKLENIILKYRQHIITKLYDLDK